jgi:CHAD domain-containing protein
VTGTPRLGADADARKARSLTLQTGEPASQAFVEVAAECVDHWRTNEALLVASRAMPHLHQTRVGIRRLRSAFSLFRPLLQDVPGARRAAHRLRELARPFGAARDLDVLLSGASAELLAPRQVAALTDARESAYDRVVEVLSSPAWNAASDAVDDLLARAPWDLPEDPPVLDLAQFALDRRWRRVVASHPLLGSMSAQERHRVRIEAKKLRYGCEFFASLYAVDAPTVVTDDDELLTGAPAYAWHVEQVQTALGALNDHAAADGLLRSVGSAAPPLDGERLVAAGADAVGRLAVLHPFWR